MNMGITREERDLIDAAVKAGLVTKVPRGASAWQVIEGVTLSPLVKGPMRDKVLGVIERRKAIRVMIGEGLSDAVIKKRWGHMNPLTVYKDIKHVRYSIDPVMFEARKKITPHAQAIRTKRRAIIRELVEQGLTLTQISKQIKSSNTTVRQDVTAMGIVPAVGYKGNPRRNRALAALGETET